MDDRPSILLVATDRQTLDLLGERLVSEGHQTIRAANLEDLDRTLQSPTGIGLALVDLSGFGDEVWTRCQQLRELKVPFLVVSPKRSASIQKQSIEYGATGMLVKPIGINEMLDNIHASLGK